MTCMYCGMKAKKNHVCDECQKQAENRRSNKMKISYKEYIDQTRQTDSRRTWVNWKMDIFGMTEKQAIQAAYNPEWGYAKPLACMIVPAVSQIVPKRSE